MRAHIGGRGGSRRSRWSIGALGAVLVGYVLAPSAHAVTISPLPGTPDASPHTQISFLGVPAREIHDVSVMGSESLTHSGRLRSYDSAPGASFIPEHGFNEGETVSVSALVGAGRHQTQVGSTFTIARRAPYRFTPMSPPPAAKPGVSQGFISAPTLKPPNVAVLTHTPSVSSDDVFVAANGRYPQRGPMIFNRAGQLVWFKPMPKGKTAMDLQVERYHGEPVLVWWQGYISGGLGVGFGTDEIYDKSYERIASVAAGNGYWADLHDLQLTPSGAAFITAYSLVEADLSPVGGAWQGALQDSILQEIDVKTGLVMFEWHAYGHVALEDTYRASPSSPTTPWDYFHINSVSLDPSKDGNFLISSRNTWAGYEIDHRTGQILWRLGGRHSSFRMGPGTETAWQHDIRWQPDHTLTLFDNGDVPKEHPQTRVVHERIDWRRREVSLIAQDVHTPALLSNSQGNDQQLPDGSSFVGWGAEPFASEFSPSGQLLFEARIASPGQSYRAYTFPWAGTPRSRPALALKPAGAETLTAYVSWNGATGVSAWQLLAGPSPTQLTPIGAVASSGFETAIPLQSTEPYFAVTAIDSAGKPLGTSAAVSR